MHASICAYTRPLELVQIKAVVSSCSQCLEVVYSSSQEVGYKPL